MGSLLIVVTLFVTMVTAGSGCAYFIEHGGAGRAVICVVMAIASALSIIAYLKETP